MSSSGGKAPSLSCLFANLESIRKIKKQMIEKDNKGIGHMALKH